MKRFVLFSMLFFAFFSLNALEVNQPELESVGKDTIEFINYTGPHSVINTKDEIAGIGSALGEKVAPNVANKYETGDNNKYLRLWYEINKNTICIGESSMNNVNISKTKWIPYSKGGPRRNWYGNYEYVVNWSQKDNFNRSKTTLQHLYLREAITWPFITSGDFSARYLPCGFLWDVAGSPCFFNNKSDLSYTLSLLTSKVANYIL